MEKITLNKIDLKEFSNYAGKIVALDFNLGSILASADNYDKLDELMNEKYPGLEYTPCGVPTFLGNSS